MSLPVEAFLPEIRRRVREEGKLLLSAAPGAGKTSFVPGALAEEFPGKKILLVEPRRVAAQAAALRISALLGEEPGTRAGFIVRGEHCCGKETQIIAMTPGVLLRKIQSDPALEDTAAVIFDEFHERSMECDLLFSFVLESCTGYREDLRLVIMSATLEHVRVQELLGVSAPLEIPGKAFPVEQLWSSEKCPVEKIPEEMAKAVLKMLPESEGNILAFFPGVGEIRKCSALLEGHLSEEFILEELHGTLPLKEQSRLLAPAPAGKRKIVLSTNVAESSLTLHNVRCVIDCGCERVPRYDSRSGLVFLETVMISRASAAQRSGRAGRTAPGKALRLWDVSSHQGRLEFRPPEILECELSSLILELALWGAEREDLVWLDPPPENACREAQSLLRSLGALDAENRITPFGKEIAKLPVHPRLGAVIAEGCRRNMGYLAIELAALLENRADTSFPDSADLELHLEHLRRNIKRYRSHKLLMEQLRKITGVPEKEHDTAFCGELLLAGFPERLARQRTPNRTAYTLRNGRGGVIQEQDTLYNCEYLAVASLGGKSSGDGTIFRAARVGSDLVLERFASQIRERSSCYFDDVRSKVLCRREKYLDALILSSTPCAPEPGEMAKGIFDAALKRKIPLVPLADKKGRSVWERLQFAHRNEPGVFPFPDERALAENAWSFFPDLTSLSQLERLSWGDVFRALLGEEMWQKLNTFYPEKFRTPAGAEHRIDYTSAEPRLAVRLQEMLGVKVHPAVGSQKRPLCLELLSPAMRPVQTTSDLPGFWEGSYKLVRKEMKAAYPKHEWPEDPAAASPMLRSVKKR